MLDIKADVGISHKEYLSLRLNVIIINIELLRVTGASGFKFLLYLKLIFYILFYIIYIFYL